MPRKIKTATSPAKLLASIDLLSTHLEHLRQTLADCKKDKIEELEVYYFESYLKSVDAICRFSASAKAEALNLKIERSRAKIKKS